MSAAAGVVTGERGNGLLSAKQRLSVGAVPPCVTPLRFSALSTEASERECFSSAFFSFRFCQVGALVPADGAE